MVRELCEGVPQFPAWAESSSRYRELVSKVALEEGLPFVYFKDHPQDTPNVPDEELGELLIIDQEKWKKYRAQPNFKSILAQDLCRIRRVVEQRRQTMVKAGADVFPIVESDTYKREMDKQLNQAEQRWGNTVKGTLYELSQTLYGIQANPQSQETTEWIRKYGDPFSQFHYERIRGPEIPVKAVGEIPDSVSFTSSVPWFPDFPSYNMMWPKNFSKAELDYLRQQYPPDDPILLSYTRVYTISAEGARKLRRRGFLKNRDGRQVEWIRGGLDGRWYRVVNMAFDSAMRPYFLKWAEVLERHVDIRIQKKGCHPQFRRFNRKMAAYLRQGNFERLLALDLRQSGGKLFMTFYPHEGYWEDGIKFPLAFELGVRDEKQLGYAYKMADTIGWLGKRVEAVSREAGLKTYRTPPVDLSNLRRDVVFFWPLITGGFLRAFKRDPGGHDYPKIVVKGIQNHRVVTLLDTLSAWSSLTQATAKELFGEEIAKYVRFEAKVAGTMMHEIGHRAQIPQNAIVGSGQTLSQSFGQWWGVLVEPWADAGGILAHHQAYRKGKISEEEYKSAVYTWIVYNFVRLHPREAALSEEKIQEGPHILGSSMYIGWLLKEGAVRKGSEGRLEFVDANIPPATEKFFDALTTYAAKGDVEGLKSFVKSCVASIPEGDEQTWLAKKGKIPSYVIVNRGELKLPPI